MKPIRIECPNCQQHIEFMPPAPDRSSFWKFLLLFILIIALGFILKSKLATRWQGMMAADQAQHEFLRNINPEKFESSYETHERWRDEAEADIGKECTNYVGFTRIIDNYLLTHDSDDPSNWTGSATIDFINQRGGAERTNLLFYCWKSGHTAFAAINESAMWDRLQKQQARRESQ